VPFDDFVLQEMMFAYRHPDQLASNDDWIRWVFRLRRRDKRHALEFVEGWNTMRIAVAGTVPWLSSCIVGIAWTAAGGDVQSAFTVASFILTSSSSKSPKDSPWFGAGREKGQLDEVLADNDVVILALLAIISSIESSGEKTM
jgi:hypothetical protein